ncbi:MAG: pyruvate ferredoxin oxidoreductase [Deltaproteobacteria bacterium]|nr:pyruvate ferredoxin oxidoreductase [Deltaproteobacteria bacterium]MBW2085798.1 pyruvate ferredoxin oxidoreductase [Deltaproteobacteria bacterium]
MKELLTGNEAVARGIGLARVEVVSAYPITPQTSVVEEVAKLCAAGKLKTRYIRIESEHSSMACTAAASMTGVRAFTATSSQGLAYMHEMLHWASGSRLPIVMVNVNRALGAPWNLWSDHSDSLSQRDTGWLQLYCHTNQECLDTLIQAFRLAETVLLPVMIVMDGFILSHTMEPVDVPRPEDVDAFLPPYEARYRLDPREPHVFNILADSRDFMRMRRQAHEDMNRAVELLEDIELEFQNTFSRSYGVLEAYLTEDAEVVLVGLGATCGTVKDVVDELRRQGFKAGLVRIRMFRPFPARKLREILLNQKKVAVLDQAVSMGAGGTLSQEVKQALFDDPHFRTREAPLVFSFITGLGGLDITPEMLERIFKETIHASGPQEEPCWMED